MNMYVYIVVTLVYTVDEVLDVGKTDTIQPHPHLHCNFLILRYYVIVYL